MSIIRPTLGIVGVIAGFDPLRKTDGEFDYLTLARGLKARTSRFTEFSLPIVPGDQCAELCGKLQALGFTLVPIVMVGEAQNPGNPDTADAALGHLTKMFRLAHDLGATHTMGPSGGPWLPACTTWGKRASRPTPADLLAERLGLAAEIHAQALAALPSGSALVHSLEYLFDGEQLDVCTLHTAVTLASAVNVKLTRRAVGITHDTAHRYGDRRYDDGELVHLFGEDAEAHRQGLITLLHVSRPGTRAHPLFGAYPLEKHLKGQWRAGYRGPIHVEVFNPGDEYLRAYLPGFLGGDPGFSMEDPLAPFIAAAEAIDRWFDETIR